MSNVRSRRVATVLLAPSVALAAWALFRAAGVVFRVSTGNGRVGAGAVLISATVAALCGWLVARWLERHVRRPRSWWMRVASVCFAASIIGPVWLADGTSSIALITLHFVTAVVIVVGLAGTVPWRRPRSSRARKAGERPAPSAPVR